MYLSITAALLAASVPLVAGHGGGMFYIIDGVTHVGSYEPALGVGTGSIQRVWEWAGFNDIDILGYKWEDYVHPINKNFSCGTSGLPYKASYHAPLTAGNVVSVNYTVPNSTDHWTFGHTHGPMLAYLAACPDAGCEGLDTTSKIWFKIWETGLLGGTLMSDNWAMGDVYYGANLDIPTPAKLKPGKYLLRHEMINMETGPAQFFPNCIQLDIKGSGTSFPDPKYLVSFPEAYVDGFNKSWPHLNGGSEWQYWEHVNDTVYPMPGPPVWTP